MVIGNGSSGVWTVEVVEPLHNHGPIMEPSRAVVHHKAKKGQIEAVPYDWPHDAGFSPFTSALVIVDMQRDCQLAPHWVEATADLTVVCSLGGYLDYQGYDVTPAQSIIPRIQDVLHAFRDGGFPVYYTREGKILADFVCLN